MREFHDLMRKDFCFLGELKDPAILTKLAYPHILCGRGNWPYKNSLAEELSLRRETPRSKLSFSNGQWTAEAYSKRVERVWAQTPSSGQTDFSRALEGWLRRLIHDTCLVISLCSIRWIL